MFHWTDPVKKTNGSRLSKMISLPGQISVIFRIWNSPVVSLYGFDGIPFNVLVDPQGKVIAERLRGSGLEGKLQEVLK